MKSDFESNLDVKKHKNNDKLTLTILCVKKFVTSSVTVLEASICVKQV